jgi:hypothetical protein
MNVAVNRASLIDSAPAFRVIEAMPPVKRRLFDRLGNE